MPAPTKVKETSLLNGTGEDIPGGRAERALFCDDENFKKRKRIAILMKKILMKEKDEGILKQNAASKSATHAFLHLFSSLTP